jgi:hypothetical protein
MANVHYSQEDEEYRRKWRDDIMSAINSGDMDEAARMLVEMFTNDTVFVEELLGDSDEGFVYGYLEISGRAAELWPLMRPQVAEGFESAVLVFLRSHGWHVR